MVDQSLIKVARGEKDADILIKNAKIVNTFSGEIYAGDVALSGGYIAGVGSYDANEVIDIKGRYLSPGFIDAHVHIESSMVAPNQYAGAVLPRGTTAVVADPHEIANVAGLRGIKYMLDSSANLPVDMYFMASSCVPSTNLETSGAILEANVLRLLLGEKRILGLGEVMNYPGVVNCETEIMEKLELFEGRVLDGHAPGLSGKPLNAYIAAGLRSDHECSTIEEAREKLRAGMQIFIREGSVAKNLDDLIKLVTPGNISRFSLASDDKHPTDLLEYGHIDFMIKRAVSSGISTVNAIRMATLNTARYFGLDKVGGIAPGYKADLVVFDDFDKLNISHVFKNGQLVVRDGETAVEFPTPLKGLSSRFNVADFTAGKLKIKANGEKVKVIQHIPGQIVTRQVAYEAKIKNGYFVSDVERDIIKVAVVERHRATGNLGLGFVAGIGLQKGALASSVAHDSHNIVVVGTNDSDMALAVDRLVSSNGGQVVACDGEILEFLPLPIGGLMSPESIEEVAQKVGELNSAAGDLGCIIENPFMVMSFLSLPVIPELRVTDMGLVDVRKCAITDIGG
ncbi:adenine deaminase [bacterium]|nr:adenine deaminase [bacterium]